MKKIFAVFILLMLVTLTSSVMANSATITLLNPPPNGVVTLRVGQSYTFDIAVNSDTPYVQAHAAMAPTYPGRGFFAQGGDILPRGTAGVLHLTITGKNSTAGMPGGIAPLELDAAVRYGGQAVVVERFFVNVVVQ
jgi:hypothetical protein